MDRSQVVNLAAGPSSLPLPVLLEASQGLLNFEGTGIGITEISHRSPEFAKLTKDLAAILRQHLNIPDTHEVLFTQGGGCGQFSAVVLNLLARHRLRFPDLKDEDRVMDYVVTGSWGEKAAQEARRLGGGVVNVVTDGRSASANGKNFDSIPPVDTWKLSERPAFIYYCENETVDGVEFDGHSSIETGSTHFPFHLIPSDPSDPTLLAPLVADYSSSFLSRPIPHLERHALIYAGAQKNIGPSGLTILIVRKDLLVDTVAAAKLGAAPVPTTFDYAVHAKAGSLYHTPPMFSMYVSLLVLRYFTTLGGVPYLAKVNEQKAKKVYAALKEGETASVFRARVKDGSQSFMNVVFEVIGEGAEARFLASAQSAGLRGVKGHRSVGGIRTSLYNAVTLDQVDLLVSFLQGFVKAEVESRGA